jgi:O-antigen/teichoic acid export membrane protein
MIPFAVQQLILALLGALLFDRMEVFILQKYAPAREIAFFSISLTLVQYLLLIPQNLAGSASVNTWVAQGRDPREAVRTAATATWFIFLFAAPQLFGVAALSDPLLRLMYGAKYLPAIPVLTLLSLCALFVAVANATRDLMVGAERQKFYIVWMCGVGVLNLASNFVLVPRYGAMGAAMAKGGTQIVLGLGFIAYLVLHFKASLPFARAARLLVACTAMFASVRLIEMRLHPLLALAVGIPVGAAVFIVLVRVLRCLDEADGGRLRRLQRMVPARARARYLQVVDFVVPPITAQPGGEPAAS